jgi:tetratricopeptide (TPR) repeat protein
MRPSRIRLVFLCLALTACSTPATGPTPAAPTTTTPVATAPLATGTPAAAAPLPAPRPETPPPAAAASALPPLGSLWDFRDPAASEQRFRDAADQAFILGDESYRVQAATQTARALGLQKRFDEARALLVELQAGLRQADLLPNVRWNLEMGRVLNSQGRGADALPYFAAAWDLANRAADLPLALDAAHMAGIAAPADAGLAWAARAIALAEDSSDPRARGWLGPLYNNTGWTRFDRGEFDEALALWRKGVAVREEMKQPAELRIAWWTVARGHRAKGEHVDAVLILTRLRDECDAAGAPDGFVHEELAENYLAMSRKDEAVPEFLRAWELLKDDDSVTGDAARSERLRTAAGLAK